MENNKREYPDRDLSLINSLSLTVSSGTEMSDEEIEKEKVHFHSDFINKAVGQLDMTV